jgi:hypothetical protein
MKRKRIMKNRNQTEEQGQSIIIVAFLFLALILFVAIAVDISSAYFERRSAQTAADAAALAGGRALKEQKEERNGGSAELIREAVNDYAQRNDIEDTNEDPGDSVNENVEAYYLKRSRGPGDPDIPGFEILEDPTLNPPFHGQSAKVPDSAVGVLAITHVRAPTFFGGVFGLDQLPLSADAAVSVDVPPCGVTCVVPIGVYWNDDPDNGTVLTYTASSPLLPSEWRPWTVQDVLSGTLPFTCYNIWDNDDTDLPGNLGWLSWVLQGLGRTPQDCDSVTLAWNLTPGECIGYLSVGEEVAGVPGIANAELVRSQLDAWIASHEPFVVPLYYETSSDELQGGGCTAYYRVSGFAVMQLLGYQLSQGGGAANSDYIPSEPSEVLQMCTNIGDVPEATCDDPNCGNRITVYFIHRIDATSLPGDCDSSGTITGIGMIK